MLKCIKKKDLVQEKKIIFPDLFRLREYTFESWQLNAARQNILQ